MVRETLAASSMAAGSSSSSSSSATATTTQPPPPQSDWVNAHERLLPQWQFLARSHQAAIPIAISRVNQVDAGRLDIEMSAMLKEQMVKIFSLMKECYSNMKQNLMPFSSFSYGDSPFGLISLLQEML